MAAVEVKLPELGENVQSGDLVKLLVKPGDTITKDQPMIELETEKAAIEVPSPVAGVVKEVHVKEGQKLKVDQLILTVETNAQPQAAAPAPKPEAAKPEPSKPTPPEAAKAPAKPAPAAPMEAKPQPVAAPPPPAPKPAPAAVTEMPRREERPTPKKLVAAAPSVRRLAREIGVQIEDVSGTGPEGRITDEDVKAHAKALLTRGAGAVPAAAPGVAAEPLPDFSRWGEIERQAMRAVRRTTARHLSYAWATIPHVTQHDKADITAIEQFREQNGKKVEAMGGKLTMTAVALKVVAGALKQFPQFAASLDMAREEIIYKKYVNIGVAVDTDRGLLVPVIREVDRKNILQLSVELNQVAEKARNKKLTPEEMEGGVFTITNLGGIGGTLFTPIVNSPEVAILGISRSAYEPKYANGNFEPRLMLPLSLSYDHRVIDGADAARFLRWVVQAFEQPFLLAFEG